MIAKKYVLTRCYNNKCVQLNDDFVAEQERLEWDFRIELMVVISELLMTCFDVRRLLLLVLQIAPGCYIVDRYGGNKRQLYTLCRIICTVICWQTLRESTMNYDCMFPVIDTLWDVIHWKRTRSGDCSVRLFAVFGFLVRGDAPAYIYYCDLADPESWQSLSNRLEAPDIIAWMVVSIMFIMRGLHK
jgi:hypothetical protein